jgi:arabinogalactan endo-1,4-beta-galactosidase
MSRLKVLALLPLASVLLGFTLGSDRQSEQDRLAIRGADVSSLTKSEDLGGIYRDRFGRPGDALRILKKEGLNFIRLRVWVDPADGYHDQEELLRMARRANNTGLKVLVDLHYSDRWADPGHQLKPAAWANLSFPELKQALYDHTYDVCRSLKDQNTPPAMIQLGNELNSGMLWPDGHTWNPPNWDNLAELLRAGHDAVKTCSRSTEVMLHLANGGDNGLYRWWFDNITSRGVQFDVIGASYYSYWHGTLEALQFNLNDVSARYGKDVVVVETAYPFTLADEDGWENIIDLPSELTPGYPATPEGQAANLRDVISVVKAVPDGRGLGVFWWEATWTGVPGNGWDPEDPSSGNAWENQALFDFDDRPLPALEEFK